MDPVTIITGITAAAGFITNMLGTSSAAKAAQQASGISQQITGLEQNEDNLRRQAMESSAQRQSLEVLRNAQRTRSIGHAAQVAQGAQFGSVVGGASGAVSGSANTNLQGIDISRMFGEQMFDINAQISKEKQQLSQVQSSEATSMGEAQLGSSLMNVAGTAGKLGGSLVGGAQNLVNSMNNGNMNSFMQGGIWPA